MRILMLGNSQFVLPKQKILIDAVESSKFITEKKSRVLVEKLLTYPSLYGLLYGIAFTIKMSKKESHPIRRREAL